MNTRVADLRGVDDAGIDAGGIVRVLVEVVDIIGECAGLDQQVAAGKVCRKADAALEIEGVGEGGALDEGSETRAGQLFQRLEIIMLADGESDRL